LRKANHAAGKKVEYEAPIIQFQAYGPQYQPLRPKGGKKITANEQQLDLQFQHAQFQASMANGQGFSTIPMASSTGMQGPHPGLSIVNGYHPIAAKGQQPNKPVVPFQPKYPIEDLEIPPTHDGTHRPPMKFLSETTPTRSRASEGAGSGIAMESVGLLLETWDTLNVYCEIFQLDSFTFDDYVEALKFSSEDIQCELLVEIHCAVLKKLVNDTNDKNGQIQVSLPDQPESEDEEDSIQSSSSQATPTPEPEAAKPPARSTRSSLVKSEAAEMRVATNGLSPADTKIHRGAEMDRSTKGYDWKMRLRKRDFQEGRWVVILVGLLNQLSAHPRYTKHCNDILIHLAPLDENPTPETAVLRYQGLDVNLRMRLLQIICMKSLETKAIRQYMEDCSAQMTEHRKEKNDVQRSRKAA